MDSFKQVVAANLPHKLATAQYGHATASLFIEDLSHVDNVIVGVNGSEVSRQSVSDESAAPRAFVVGTGEVAG